MTYCRFVDDYRIFAPSRESAHRALLTISEILQRDEGLSLQKTKSRISTSSEFLGKSVFAPENRAETPDEESARDFVRLRLHFDPYSATRDEDYEALQAELSRFDVVGMLGRELVKSRIDEVLTRRLVAAIRLLNPLAQQQAVSSLIENLEVLYPIFSSVMLVLRGVMESINADTREKVFRSLRNLIAADSHITQVPTHLAFALRILASDDSGESDALVARLYKSPHVNMMLKRDIIMWMGYRKADHWISHQRKYFATLTSWEKRALLICSYLLGDEGKHWRTSIKERLSRFDRVVMEWTADRKNTLGNDWRVPL